MDRAKKTASNTVASRDQIDKKLEQKLTVLWHEIDAWQQDNHYILSGYRPQSYSYQKSLQSLGYLHNESVNIYTHTLGAIAALLSSIVLYCVLAPGYKTATREDVWVFSCFFFGAIACLSLSAAFHTISNHSHEVARFGNQLDYCGIVLLIWGSFIPVLYYGFKTEPQLMKTYWTMITTFAACTSAVSTHPKFRTPALRPFRALMFVMMGLSAVIPMFHGIRVYGLTHMRKAASLDWVVLQGVLYILGAVIYAARVPEKWNPGRYDIWGSSHQIFHILVVMAATTHLAGLLQAFNHEHCQRAPESSRSLLGDCPL